MSSSCKRFVTQTKATRCVLACMLRPLPHMLGGLHAHAAGGTSSLRPAAFLPAEVLPWLRCCRCPSTCSQTSRPQAEHSTVSQAPQSMGSPASKDLMVAVSCLSSRLASSMSPLHTTGAG